MITNKQAVAILKVATAKFPIDFNKQEYREFTCANCYKKIRKAWHVHCKGGGFKREIHFCTKCGGKYGLKSNNL